MNESKNLFDKTFSSKKKTKIPKEKPCWLKRHPRVVILALAILFAALSLYLWMDSISVGASALVKNYDEAYQMRKDQVYQEFYQYAYDKAERKYHISNTAVISIGDLEEAEKLEVLKANGIEFITQNRERESGYTTAWLEVSGEGTFVVDLKTAEFIVDNVRRYVLIRVPYPELTNITIVNAVEHLYKEDWWRRGSEKRGINLAIAQYNEARLRIQKSLISNQYIYDNAKIVAKSTIANLVKQFNSEIPDLTVAVEFMD